MFRRYRRRYRPIRRSRYTPRRRYSTRRYGRRFYIAGQRY